MADIETTEKPGRNRARKGAGKAAGKGAGKVAGKGAGKGMHKGKGKAAPADMESLSTLANKRKVKRQRAADANKITFILETEVREHVMAEAKAAGMDIAPFMQRLVENHVLATAPDENPLAQRLKAKRAALDHIVMLARKVDAEGGFDDHFILNVMRKASADPQFQALYSGALDADLGDEKAVARAKAPMNQQLGRLIKRAAGAKSKRDQNGKILRGQVSGEVITTYTLLEKPTAAAAA